MINSKPLGQWTNMESSSLAIDCVDAGARATPDDEDAGVRLRRIFDANYDFVWRTLRRLGLDAGEADDGAQQVFVVLSRRLGEIRAGGERAYAAGVAFRVASDARKRKSRRSERPSELVDETIDPAPSADEELDRHRARALLDRALEALPMPLRLVFTLHEVEEMSMAEIAEVMGIPPGTVASRLRKARQDFESIVAKMSKRPRGATQGGGA